MNHNSMMRAASAKRRCLSTSHSAHVRIAPKNIWKEMKVRAIYQRLMTYTPNDLEWVNDSKGDHERKYAVLTREISS